MVTVDEMHLRIIAKSENKGGKRNGEDNRNGSSIIALMQGEMGDVARLLVGAGEVRRGKYTRMYASRIPGYGPPKVMS